MVTTLREMRRDIARQMSDILIVTAESGSNNMFVDPVELTDYDSTFSGSQAVCISSAHPENVGKVVRIVGNSQHNNNISFTPNLPESVEPGDVFDLHNLRGRGFRVQDYNQQISSVIRHNRHKAPRLAASDPVVFDADSPFIDIPEGWISVHGVSAHVDDHTFDVHAGRYDGARGWRVDQTGRRVEISGMDAGAVHGLEVVLHGHMGHPPVEQDDDKIYLNPDFLAKTVMSNLAQRRGDQHWNQWAAEWAQMAAGVRPGALHAWPANTIMIEEF